jgi:ABC-type nitrate/sulfonate/bicarbonate transport system permease component
MSAAPSSAVAAHWPGAIAFNWRGWGLIVAFTLLLQVLVGHGVLDSHFVPLPSAVARAFRELVVSGQLFTDTLHTLSAALVGGIAASAVGVFAGTCIGLFDPLRRYTLASVEVLRAIPGITYVPLTILLLGFTLEMEITTIFIVCTWIVLINAVAGAQAVTEIHEDVAHTLRLSPLDRIFKLALPTAVPYILTGMNLAFTTALAFAVAVEIVGNPAGLGYAILFFQQALRPDAMFAVIIWVGLLGLGLNLLFTFVTSRWQAANVATAIEAARKRRGVQLPGLLPLIAVLIAWQLLQHGQSPYFPRPSLWVDALADLASSGKLLVALVATVRSFVVALLLAVLIGSSLGMIVGRSRSAALALGPIFALLRCLPAAALVPVAVLFGGYTESMKLQVVVFVAIWPVLMTVQAGAERLSPARIELARSLHFSPWQGVAKVLLPSMVPFILLGARITAPVVLIIVLLVEIVTQVPGLGGLLSDGQQNYQAAEVYGIVAISGVLGLGTSFLVSYIERLAMGYRSD